MGHSHGHAPSRRRLVIVLALTVAVMVVEAVVAWTSGSLALLADAGHLLTDAAAIVLALAAMSVARVEVGAASRRSFGWARVEVLAAGVNAHRTACPLRVHRVARGGRLRSRPRSRPAGR